MKVKRIDLDDDEMPERILVELSHDEAVYLAVLLGKQSPSDREAILRGGGSLGGGVYNGLVGTVFNTFYEDGVNDAVAAMRGSE
ncbi:hypothetical protein J7E97_08285 [Streptomyces sp. ISL-66]|uniref:hypothetical protein n=1 Tax=Streptomyces sp. ISL-66 TaxID=2819186 RepID=UPI001BEBE19D|nr:hypothetical protein [Streptomyces sp. ISL-66]MBT2467872.1 hypothetical protein [Streptomyces sp. ISL-66]